MRAGTEQVQQWQLAHCCVAELAPSRAVKSSPPSRLQLGLQVPDAGTRAPDRPHSLPHVLHHPHIAVNIRGSCLCKLVHRTRRIALTALPTSWIMQAPSQAHTACFCLCLCTLLSLMLGTVPQKALTASPTSCIMASLFRVYCVAFADRWWWGSSSRPHAQPLHDGFADRPGSECLCRWPVLRPSLIAYTASSMSSGPPDRRRAWQGCAHSHRAQAAGLPARDCP